MNPNKKKILMVTPLLPFPPRAANQLNRAGSIRLLKRAGYDVRLIAFARAGHEPDARGLESKYGITIRTVPYRFARCLSDIPLPSRFVKKAKKLLSPHLWDGSAAVFYDCPMQEVVKGEVERYKPDYFWPAYTYLWPLYRHARKNGIPIIVHSHNFEPTHFLEEEGYSLPNLMRFVPKLVGDLISIHTSDFLFAISPNDEKAYRMLGARKTATLPSGALPFMLKERRTIEEKRPIRLLFMGSSYTALHNREAVRFLVHEVMPRLEREVPGRFVLHVTGGKLPHEVAENLPKNIVHKGFIDNLETLFGEIDIAVIPSILGGGMQLKIFEPLARGIPTITSPRGLAGYPFEDGIHLMLAESAEDYVSKILALEDVETRRALSQNALRRSRELFSEDRMRGIITQALRQI